MYIREGSYQQRPRQVKCETVQVALRAVATAYVLDGQPNPMVTTERRYYLPLARQLESWKRQDPPPKPQLALPVAALRYIRKQVEQFSHNVSSRMIKHLSFFTTPDYQPTREPRLHLQTPTLHPGLHFFDGRGNPQAAR